MSLSAGIVGLPNVGKSTLFNALTSGKAASANYPFCTIDPNVGIVEIPDNRLERINRLVPVQRLIPATLEVIDIAGLVKGASRGEGLGNKFLAHIREVDAIIHVVRCFEDEDISHVEPVIDPIRDMETIETELLLADMETLDKRKQRIQKMADPEHRAELNVIKKASELIDHGTWLYHSSLTPNERQCLKPLFLLTLKPVMILANLDEEGLIGENPLLDKLKAHTDGKVAVLPLCGAIEAEIASLPPEEAAGFLQEYGLEESGLMRLAHEAYRLLDLESFFSTGVQEIRAWTIKKGTKAPQAAGVIHTDFERGFIKAEVYKLKDLEACGSEAELRNRGLLRIEGKEYEVQDGDIILFRFNV